MSKVKISLFGHLSVECDKHIWPGPEGCKARELFCYLLLHHTSPHRREHLASLLWEDSSTAQSKKYFRQTLWQLQAACDEHLGQAGRRWLLVNSEWVQVNPAAELWLDVAAFEQAFSRLPATRLLDAASAQALREAVLLYREDLLVGWYQDWCLYERERLQDIFLLMLDRLVEYCEANQDYAAGVDCGARILHCDPARERTHQQLMRMYYLAGDRTAALRQFDRCAEVLRKELDVAPTLSTCALREQICADRLAPLTAPPAAAPAALLPAVLANLKRLQDKLVELQRELQRDIQVVEQFLPQVKDPD